MKKFLLASVALLSLNAFSQSYMVLHNGVTLSTDKAGFVYDFGQFILPYKVKITGGQFMVVDDKLVTFDAQGMMYRKDEEVKKIKGKGQNYFINKDSELVTINSKGFFFKFDKEKAFKKDASFGGNYLVVATDAKKKIFDLFTINDAGNYTKITLPGLNPASIAAMGGNYFMTQSGMIYTVSKDGFVFSKNEVRTGAFKRAGGNFFIDSSNKLYTISDAGVLMTAVTPETLVPSKIIKSGVNYMIDTDGKVFTVDSEGAVHERFIKDHDLRNVQILSK